MFMFANVASDMQRFNVLYQKWNEVSCFFWESQVYKNEKTNSKELVFNVLNST
jgi:hypothetical protein